MQIQIIDLFKLEDGIDSGWTDAQIIQSNFEYLLTELRELKIQTEIMRRDLEIIKYGR